MDRRSFVLGLGVLGGTSLWLRSPGDGWATEASSPGTAVTFKLPPLPYAFNALEPHIDRRTMEIHHDKHHGAYVTNLNNALAKYPKLQGQSLATLLATIQQLPSAIRTVIRNNGGGHFNHSMYWQIMSPQGGGQPKGKIGAAIASTFGSFTAFQQKFEAAGMQRFGSGWVWLVKDRAGKLQITTTPNQDNPIMTGEKPILGNDLWEHAYYLNYQNKRADYQKAWWKVVNWDEVDRRFQSIG
jgi:superoxide dismutase, Fe-Mn family